MADFALLYPPYALRTGFAVQFSIGRVQVQVPAFARASSDRGARVSN